MSNTDANSFTSSHPPQTPLLIPQLLGNSRPHHTLFPTTLRMSTLHSPLDTTAGMQTKNQSPKQKGFASYLPISPTPLLRKRLGTIPAYEHNSHAGNGAKYSTGRGEIGQKKRAQRTRRLILPFSLTPGRGIGIILPQIQRRGGNRDGERNGGVFGLREGDGGERWGYYLEYLGCEGRRGRAYAV